MMEMYGSKATKLTGKKKSKAKKGMHKMPNGKMMNNSSMKKMGKKKWPKITQKKALQSTQHLTSNTNVLRSTKLTSQYKQDLWERQQNNEEEANGRNVQEVWQVKKIL